MDKSRKLVRQTLLAIAVLFGAWLFVLILAGDIVGDAKWVVIVYFVSSVSLFLTEHWDEVK